MRRAPRIAGAFCLAATLLLQGFALAGQMVALAHGGDVAHAVMHSDSVAHHHEHDGSIHQDGSPQSLDHVQGDCCVAPAGIPPGALHPVPAMAEPAARVFAVHDGYASPFLEGLKRPPR